MSISSTSPRNGFPAASARPYTASGLLGIAAMLALGTMSCVNDASTKADSDGNRSHSTTGAVAARMPVGSTANYTLISTLTQLRNMELLGNYRLANNIDASPTATAPFVPVGGVNAPFQGTFDGNGFVIDKLTINSGSTTGMFGQATGALLKNISLTNVKVTGGYSTGAIAGRTENVDLISSYVTGTVTGKADCRNLGMAIGSASSWTRISRCYATGTVNGYGVYVGGFVGTAYSYGDVTVEDDPRVYIEEVFTNVIVAPTTPPGISLAPAGGLVGHAQGTIIKDINTVGPVTGRGAAGGIVGFVENLSPNSKRTVLKGTMSRGVVTDAATPQRAGAIGLSTGYFLWCGASFWDTGTDTGIPNPNISDPGCQTGLSSDSLRAAHPSPNKLLMPYIYGMLITQSIINEGNVASCKLASGSDGDWGFGTCGEPQIWAANANNEYNTLTRIPNPGVQPKGRN